MCYPYVFIRFSNSFFLKVSEYKHREKDPSWLLSVKNKQREFYKNGENYGSYVFVGFDTDIPVYNLNCYETNEKQHRPLKDSVIYSPFYISIFSM